MSLFASSPSQRADARRWLMLAVAALAASGIFPPLLVLVRSRSAGQEIPLMQYFHTAIVVHVDLSVLVWFLCIACMFWSLIQIRRPLLSGFAFWTTAAGALAMALSPLAGGEPMMNEYIPVLLNPLFFLSLGLIASGMVCKLAAVLIPRHELDEPSPRHKRDALHFGILSAAAIAGLSFVAVCLTHAEIDAASQDVYFYHTLFWGGGHLFQFTHTQLMMVSWLCLAGASGVSLRLPQPWLKGLFALGLAAVMAGFYPYLAYAPEEAEHHQFFTDHMIWLGGFAPVLLGAYLLFSLLARGLGPGQAPARAALVCSAAMFALGGTLGLMISGANVVIPAHYHGSIVAVTLAYMGMAYLLLPEFGGAPVSARWATAQPILFAAGQAMHAVGLALAGGHGAERKSTESLDLISSAFLAKHLIRWGGLLAVLGGVVFIVLCIRSLRRAVKQG